jgi:hypothetical protein
MEMAGLTLRVLRGKATFAKPKFDDVADWLATK